MNNSVKVCEKNKKVDSRRASAKFFLKPFKLKYSYIALK